MEYTTHRLRFGNWRPQAIRSLACDSSLAYIAVGREDGDIEIFDCEVRICTQPIFRIPGQENFQLRQILWKSSRLFGISLRGFIFECDLRSLTIKNVRDTYGGAAWCMTSTSRTQNLAVGCDDGSCRLFSTENDSLEYQRTLPASGSRILSVAFHPSKPQLFMGGADGIIRCVDDVTGRNLFRMSANIAPGVPVHILCLHVLSDSTVISGDSQGNVQFWDGVMGVLTTTIHQHAAQILALAVDPSENFIFASGVDTRVTCLRRVNGESKEDEASDMHWVYTTSHRIHSHDVYSLAICQHRPGQETSTAWASVNCPLSARHGPLLLSGGVDTKLCLYSVKDFSKYRPIHILPIPSKRILSTSADGTMMALQHSHHIDIWRMNYIPVSQVEDHLNQTRRILAPVIPLDMTDETDKEEKSISLQTEQRCFLLGTIQLKDPNNIVCTAISPCGSLLVASTVMGTRMWQLDILTASRKIVELLQITKVELPLQLNTHSTALCFSNDGSSFAVATSKGVIWFADIHRSDGKAYVQLRDSLDHKDAVLSLAAVSKRDESSSYAVTEMAFNSDSQWLGVSTIQRRAWFYDIDRY